jgi:hypothetical protein
METSFGQCLGRLRRQAGFSSAYHFYHGNGGRRHFGFTYVHYLRVEKGRSLPPAQRLPLLAIALRLSPGQEGAKALYLSYLRTLLGQEAYETVLAPLLSAQGPVKGQSRAPLAWLTAQHTVHLTPDQFELLASDGDVYWCSEMLLNDSESWTIAALAEKLGRPDAAIKAALGKLEKGGLVRKAGSGRYRTKHPGKIFTFPGRLASGKGALAKIQGYWNDMHSKRGGEAGSRVELVRAEDGAMRSFRESLWQAVDGANAYATPIAGETTGFYLVEARMRRLMPF